MSHPSQRNAPGESDLSGRQLGDFRVLRRLGRGAMAEVYLAEQQTLRRQVALKVLKANLAGDETYVRRFHHEAQAAAALVHANIVQIYDVGCIDGVHYIAQEYVQGQNLRELMQRHGPPELKLAVAIIRQAAAALAKAAERGIVHRDIKPENIMLARSGEVKVADFGLARLADSDGLALTQVGITMGTPLYMSPEQVEGRALDPRSDIYSLGVTCYHMLAGEPPFTGETALAVAVQHLKREPRRLDDIRPDLPRELCRMVHRMLAKQPDERQSTPRDLLRELRQLPVDTLDGQIDLGDMQLDADLLANSGLAEATSQLDVLMKTSAVELRRERRRWWWLPAALVAGLLLGAAANWLTREPFLLRDARQIDVPAQASAREQFFIAQMQLADKEEWLRSVAYYFADDAYYTARAREELARLYLQQSRYEEARDEFASLAAMDDEEFRAAGLAGLAFLATIEQQLDEAARLLGELAPLRDKLDPRMAQLTAIAFDAVRRALDEQTANDWAQWQQSLPEPEEPLE